MPEFQVSRVKKDLPEGEGRNGSRIYTGRRAKCTKLGRVLMNIETTVRNGAARPCDCARIFKTREMGRAGSFFLPLAPSYLERCTHEDEFP